MALLGTWAKRIAITIDHTKVDADLVDFPVCIHLAAAAGISSDDVSAVFDELTSDANRKKIAVTTSDGSSECYVEIEKWDTTNEQAVLHVKVPSVSSSADTTLYIYYDSAQAENTSYVGDTGDAVSQNVWDSYYSFVLHMIRQSDGSVKDSSVNALDWTSNGMDASNNGNDSTTGKSYLTFDGTEYLTGNNSSLTSPGSGGFHLEAVFNTVFDYSADGGILYQDYGTDINNLLSIGCFLDTGYTNKIKYWLRDSSRNAEFSYSSTNINNGVNHHVAISRNAINNLDSSLDGTQYSTVTATCGTIYLSSGYAAKIGTTPGSLNYDWRGKILEVRFSKGTGRSSSWNKATYNTLFDTLLTFTAEENVADQPINVPNALCALLALTPAVNPYHVAGIVQEQGSAVARTVRLYDRSTGALVDSVVSDAGDGSFDFSDIDGKVYTVIAFDADAGSDFNALIYDRVQATQAS